MPATNKPFSVRGASVFELQDDKFKPCSDYWNMATVLKQSGLMPSVWEKLLLDEKLFLFGSPPRAVRSLAYGREWEPLS